MDGMPLAIAKYPPAMPPRKMEHRTRKIMNLVFTLI
jgi:hypothetical protein